MIINLKEFLHSISFCLDFVEMDILGATTHHSKRVAYISLRLGDEFGLNENEKFELFTYAILHDNGLSEEKITVEAKKIEKNRLENIEHIREHCKIGERNIKSLPFLKSKNIVQYHHEFYNGSGFFGLKGDEIPLMAQIICLADYTDNQLHFEIPSSDNKKKIIEFINKKKNIFFSEDLVDAFMNISSKVSFWADLRTPFLFSALNEITPDKVYEFPYKELLEFTSIFSKIIDSKSRFTMEHSSGLVEKTEKMCEYYKFDNRKSTLLMVAANLHDLGKLAVPNTILDKPGALDENEFEIIKHHTYYTRAALKNIKGFEQIYQWASNHHEKLDGSGYPYGFKKDKLDFESRLLACLDIYQALTENRPYRKSMNHVKAISILKNLAKNNKIDAEIVEHLDIVMDNRQ